jgi:hypothetical protein
VLSSYRPCSRVQLSSLTLVFFRVNVPIRVYYWYASVIVPVDTTDNRAQI